MADLPQAILELFQWSQEVILLEIVTELSLIHVCVIFFLSYTSTYHRVDSKKLNQQQK